MSALDATATPSRSRFRPDIQGLRALAVAGVVLNHARLSVVGGGYAGVDVFFVISGFLITDHLARTLQASNRIGFGSFYARRARRILPAAFLVIGLTLIAAMFVLPDTMRDEAVHDGLAAALYVPNYIFAHRATDYFSNPTPSLFQHYWSLGVEEQFYVVWPLILLVAWWIGSQMPLPGSWRRWAPRLALLIGAIVVGVVSAEMQRYAMRTDPSFAFFSATTRAWEFAAGGSVAVALLILAEVAEVPPVQSLLGRRSVAVTVSAVRIVGGWIGLAGIVFAFLHFSSTTVWPTLKSTGVPVICTALVILMGSAFDARKPRRFDAARLLSLAAFVWLGGISYSLYLVHWPMLQIAQAEFGYGRSVPLWLNLLLAAAGVPIAWLLMRLVENPLRRSVVLRPTRRALLAAVGGSASLAVLCLGLAQIADSQVDGLRGSRVVAATRPLTDPPRQVGGVVPANLHPGLNDQTPGTPLFYNGCTAGRSCHYGDPADPRVELFGDSIGASWYPALTYAAAKLHFYIQTETLLSCAPGVRIHYWGAESIPQTTCNGWRVKQLQAIRAHPPRVLIVAEYGGLNSDGGPNDTLPADNNVATWLQGLGDVLAATSKSTKLIIIHAGPQMLVDIPVCLREHLKDALACAVPRTQALDTVSRRAETIFAAEHPGRVHLIDLDNYVCGPSVCPPIIGNTMVWMDAYHFTAAFSRLMGPPLTRSLRELGVT